MRGGWRLIVAIWGAGLALGPAVALAQSTDAAPSAQPADTVGPRELQNFSLSGTVTKSADEPAAQPSTAVPAATPTESAPMRSRPARESVTSSQPIPKAPVTSTVALHHPTVSPPQAPIALAAPDPAPVKAPVAGTPAPQPLPTANVAPPTITASAPLPVTPEHGLPIWPWLLAALALAAGMAFLFVRNRQRHAFAGGPDFDVYVAPDPPDAPRAPTPPAPAPKSKLAPRPDPAPSPPVPPKGPVTGLVSSRLRPAIELAIQPLRCIVEEQQVAVEFELELFNSGNSPARDLLVEAAIFNAGPMQDQEIGAFMSKPVGAGERLETILPLQRMSLRTQVIAPRETLQIFEIGGRELFVPLIAFNALYRWNSQEGQTSVSYLLGRVTKGEKLAPFRVDLGPRVFRGLAARPLPLELRR